MSSNLPPVIEFGLIGGGWRSEFFLRIAAACPERFRITGLAGSSPARVAALAARFGVPVFASPAELAREARPLFAVSCVPWDANPGVVKTLAELGVPALCETPPARTIEEMEELCALARRGAKIQVAEQYSFQPHHAARLAFIATGKLGRVSQAQVSAAHGYHGASLVRRFLGLTYEPPKIVAKTFASPILKPRDSHGPAADESLVESRQLLALLDFGDRLGVFDFADEQYFAETRNPRVLIRGERGELVNDRGFYMQAPDAPIWIEFVRHEAGTHGNLDGHYLKGIQAGESWIYRNPVAPARLYDDEIAIATCLLKMAEYARGGPEFYPVAEACQDRYLDMLMHEAADSGKTVEGKLQSWAQ